MWNSWLYHKISCCLELYVPMSSGLSFQNYEFFYEQQVFIHNTFSFWDDGSDEWCKEETRIGVKHSPWLTDLEPQTIHCDPVFFVVVHIRIFHVLVVFWVVYSKTQSCSNSENKSKGQETFWVSDSGTEGRMICPCFIHNHIYIAQVISRELMRT